MQSNVLQPEAEKEANRKALFASIEGNLEIGGAAARAS